MPRTLQWQTCALHIRRECASCDVMWNSLCICPLAKSPKSPPRLALLQSLSLLAISAKVCSPSTMDERYPGTWERTFVCIVCERVWVCESVRECMWCEGVWCECTWCECVEDVDDRKYKYHISSNWPHPLITSCPQAKHACPQLDHAPN